MIVRCPHCGTGHAVRYQPGRSPGTQHCDACGQAFAFFPALEIEAVGLPRDGARMEPVPLLQVPIPRHVIPEERPAPPRAARGHLQPADRTGTRAARWHDGPLRVAGLLVGLLLIAALWVQFLIHERASLGAHPELAALSDGLCRVLPCPGPGRRVPGAIGIADLRLEQHAQGWLRLEIMITNRLDRTQPWPMLEVRFSDRFGRILGEARWHPAEYLGTDAAAEATPGLEARATRRLRLVLDTPADDVQGVSVRAL